MKKNAIIGALVLISALSLGYGYTQKIHVDEIMLLAQGNEQKVKECKRIAMEHQAIAERQREMVQAMVAESQMQFARAEAALKEAQRKNKK